MEFRIADTFTDSLGRLTSQEQKVAKRTALDLYLKPIKGQKFDRQKSFDKVIIGV